MQKGYKRNGKVIAVFHFFIGLILVAMLIGIVYFLLEKMDYSDKLADPQATMRAYVEMTASPDSVLTNGNDPQPEGTEGAMALVDLTNTATPEPTAIPTPTPTPEPTPIPTPTPEPTPTPTPTPEPTTIPSSKLSTLRKSGFNVPSPSTNATLEVTNLYVSEPNKNTYVEIQGYAYIDEATYDASKAQIFLIVTQEESGKQIAYKAASVPGISGNAHEGAQCQNPTSADFDVILSVSKFSDGNYGLGVVLYYDLNGSTAYSYHEFSEAFTVKDGKATASEAGFSIAAASDEGDAVEPQVEAEPTPAVDAFGAPLDGSSIG